MGLSTVTAMAWIKYSLSAWCTPLPPTYTYNVDVYIMNGCSLWPWLKCVLSEGDNAARTASGEVLLLCVIVQQSDNANREGVLLQPTNNKA